MVGDFSCAALPPSPSSLHLRQFPSSSPCLAGGVRFHAGEALDHRLEPGFVGLDELRDDDLDLHRAVGWLDMIDGSCRLRISSPSSLSIYMHIYFGLGAVRTGKVKLDR
ncbi:hypothetical protein HPP92_000555 [Vanilla planifolia]|uniref:Uncharacterized protein n=1 Tax=Vanilla planifolia TaxID=51239 RepID=A0A835VKP9_VANPL|nr:hypothetical protein HPP92_000555 [Vanilla planifolia]